jgi:hypothetical protein
MMKFNFFLITLFISFSSHAQYVKERYLQRIDAPDKFVTLDFKAPLTLLVIWKADCKDCSYPMRDARALAEGREFKGLVVYGLFSDVWSAYHDRAKTQVPTTLPQLHDPDSRFLKTMRGVKHASWVLIDNEGEILGEAKTANERMSMKARVQRILAGKGK